MKTTLAIIMKSQKYKINMNDARLKLIETIIQCFMSLSEVESVV